MHKLFERLNEHENTRCILCRTNILKVLIYGPAWCSRLGQSKPVRDQSPPFPGSVCTLSIMEAYRKRGVISIRFRMRGSQAFSKPLGKRCAGVGEWRRERDGASQVPPPSSHSGGGDVINDFLNKRSVCKLSVQRTSLGNDCSPGEWRKRDWKG